MLGAAAGTAARFGPGAALDAQATRAAGAAPAIIDWHAHWVGPRVVELLAARPSPRPPQGAGWFDLDSRLRHMDEAGVQRQILSWVGAAYDGILSPDDARPIWRAQNDNVAAAVKKYPARFSGLATLPTANVAWAAAELERAHTELGLIGAVLPLDAFVTLAGARALAPIFTVAQKHRSHIFVHRGAAAPDIPTVARERATIQWLRAAGAALAPAPGDNVQARSSYGRISRPA
jgi:predicted TIM-barrel fold metal-dependent hydrolase